MKRAIYPGSFDPITNGHIDILKRALAIFDEVIVLVAVNEAKKCRFSTEERVQMIKEATKDMKGVSVDSADCLTVEYARAHGCNSLIRGLRAVTDFEYEFSLSAANNYLAPEIDTIFLISHAENSFISSSVIDGMHEKGADISKLVPQSVVEMYKKK